MRGRLQLQELGIYCVLRQCVLALHRLSDGDEHWGYEQLSLCLHVYQIAKVKALGGSFTYASHYTCKFYVHYQGVVLRGACVPT